MDQIINRKYGVVIIGGSAGSLNVVKKILAPLPADFSLPVILVCHRHPDSGGYFEKNLNDNVNLQVKQIDEKEKIRKGFVYVAPADYHLLIEDDGSFSFTLDEPFLFSRPSIDVTFESAAEVWNKKLVGIVVTGANCDGSNGLMRIKEVGGFTAVQAPKSAECKAMPESAVQLVSPDLIGTPDELGEFMFQLHNHRGM